MVFSLPDWYNTSHLLTYFLQFYALLLMSIILRSPPFYHRICISRMRLQSWVVLSYRDVAWKSWNASKQLGRGLEYQGVYSWIEWGELSRESYTVCDRNLPLSTFHQHFSGEFRFLFLRIMALNLWDLFVFLLFWKTLSRTHYKYLQSDCTFKLCFEVLLFATSILLSPLQHVL